MPFPNELPTPALRRISISLLSTAGALLLSAFGLIGAGVSGENVVYARGVANALSPLAYCCATSIICYVWTELADHDDTPEHGHPHSKVNYRQSAFALLVTAGLGFLIWGFWELVSNAQKFGA